jgi:orotate phosphoribosyltransferase
MLVADRLGLPFIYVRSGAKEHGLGNQIEGFYEARQPCCCHRRSYLNRRQQPGSAVKALSEAGCEVLGMLAIFTYGFSKAANAFENEKCSLETLSNYNSLIELAVETGYVSPEELQTLMKWREDPSKWGV